MLVLSRKTDQAIVIGEVLIKVLRVRGRVVQIGIDAPKYVPIHRVESAGPEQPIRDDTTVFVGG